MHRIALTEEEVINYVTEQLTYDPNTGEIKWRTRDTGRPGRRRQAGDITFIVTDQSGALRRRLRLVDLKNKTMPATHVACIFMEGIYPPAHGLEVDHQNRETLDDRWENLRIVTRHQNLKNRRHKPRADNSSGLPACVRPYEYKDGTTRYSYVGRVDGVWHTSKQGEFETPEEASEAWIKIKTEKGGFY